MKIVMSISTGTSDVVIGLEVFVRGKWGRSVLGRAEQDQVCQAFEVLGFVGGHADRSHANRVGMRR